MVWWSFVMKESGDVSVMMAGDSGEKKRQKLCADN